MDGRCCGSSAGRAAHGVDLLMLSPGDKVVVIEVKGTLVAKRFPRMSRRELGQMSAAWVDKHGNPGMAELNLGNADVYGGGVVVNFADGQWRAALTNDFVALRRCCTQSSSQTSAGLTQQTQDDAPPRSSASPPDPPELPTVHDAACGLRSAALRSPAGRWEPGGPGGKTFLRACG